MTFAICRIIGNELPPRDRPGARLAALQHVIESDPHVDRFWVLNHIHDPWYRDRVVDLLRVYGQSFSEVTFDSARYARLSTRFERLAYAINVNHARNVAIALTRPRYDFAVCLDQDCFFTPELWARAADFITDDQTHCPERQYYGLMMKRLTDGLTTDASGLPDEEPQLVFRRDAELLFDPDVPFGHDSKLSLLRRLGYLWPTFALEGDRCRTAGLVLHVPSGTDEAETDFATRVSRRLASLDALLRRLDAEIVAERASRAEMAAVHAGMRDL